MPMTPEQEQYQREAKVLAQIGTHLAKANIAPVEVRLPRALANLALAAWTREEEESQPGHENHSQRMQRHRAGALALIGLSIERGGRAEGDEVVVSLSPDLIGEAFIASDDLSS